MGGFQCGRIVVKGQPKDAWTCPCGLGYWDGRTQEFITGDRVRRGEVMTKVEYRNHLSECAPCRTQAQKDNLLSERTEMRVERQRGIEMAPETIPPTEPPLYSPRGHAAYADRRRLFILPSDGIAVDVMGNHAGRLLGSDVSWERGIHPVRPLYTIPPVP